MIEKLDPANLGVGPDDETIAKINEVIDDVNALTALFAKATVVNEGAA